MHSPRSEITPELWSPASSQYLAPREPNWSRTGTRIGMSANACSSVTRRTLWVGMLSSRPRGPVVQSEPIEWLLPLMIANWQSRPFAGAYDRQVSGILIRSTFCKVNLCGKSPGSVAVTLVHFRNMGMGLSQLGDSVRVGSNCAGFEAGDDLCA